LTTQANEYRVALNQLRVENAALEIALQENANAPRAEQDQDALAEVARQTRIAEAHLQVLFLSINFIYFILFINIME
jgi:hypothetical protein